MTALVIRGDAARLPLPDDSVDLIVTSPPYLWLRSYVDNGQHYPGQIGDEASPQAFIDALLDCTQEWARVLKPSGSMFINLGDKYSGALQQNSGREALTSSADYWRRANPKRTGIPNKSLMLLPERYRIGCVDRLGLIARAVIVWDKPNGLPESVTDRVRRSHEDWVHLTLQPRYYSAVDEIREPYSPNQPWGQRTKGKSMNGGAASGGPSAIVMEQNSLGKLPGSVWTIPSEPLTVPDHLGVDHFAAFPTEWPRRIISGWSPAGICTACGEGRRPVTATERSYTQRTYTGSRSAVGVGNVSNSEGRVHQWLPGRNEATITGYACACPTPDAPTRPSIIVDPFAGTGTTALCASVLGRIGITVDLSHDYSRLALWRTQDAGQRARAMRVEKPPVQLDGQQDLFGGAA